MASFVERARIATREKIPYGDATHPLIWSLAHLGVGQYLKYRFDIEIYGRQHLRGKKQKVFAPTHTWTLDPEALGAAVEDQALATMAKAELWTDKKRYRKYGLQLGRILQIVDAFPVKRGVSDRDALRKTKQYLASGRSVGVFGAGRRTLDFYSAHKTPALLAYSQKTELQPIAIGVYKDVQTGTESVRVVASKPLTPDRSRSLGEEKRRLTDELAQIHERDHARATAWAKHDARYAPRKRLKLGRIKRYA